MRLFRIILRLEQAVRRSGMRCEGINLFLADDEAAFREFPHVHFHIVPRYRGDAFRITADWSHPSGTELDGTAARIHEAHSSLWGSKA
jgi:diadenosine tetraphosphate (Ap4A) HIT family hydrolase